MLVRNEKKANEFSDVCGPTGGGGWNFEVGAITIRPRNREGRGAAATRGGYLRRSLLS